MVKGDVQQLAADFAWNMLEDSCVYGLRLERREQLVIRGGQLAELWIPSIVGQAGRSLRKHLECVVARTKPEPVAKSAEQGRLRMLRTEPVGSGGDLRTVGPTQE